MKFQFGQGEPIDNSKTVKVKKMNHVIEVVSLAHKSENLSNIRKLSKEKYVHIDTGEIGEYQQSENRGQNIEGLKETFRKIRDLVNNNFTGAENELHLTLTYAENMKDTKRLYDDFKAFWQRFKRKYGKGFEYMSVIEPQGRGAWHCHVLIKCRMPGELFIPSAELANLWGHGFIKVKTLKGVDNIGAYLSAYLTDVEVTAENIQEIGFDKIHSCKGIKEVEVQGVKKSFIKGARVHMYPPGMNLYRHSKGIEPPEEVEMTYADIKKIVGPRTPNYSRTVKIVEDTEGQEKILNCITYENYNTKRQGGETIG